MRAKPTVSSYSITMRLHTAPDHAVVGAVATTIASSCGIVSAIDVTESSHERLVLGVDIGVFGVDPAVVKPSS